MRCYYHKIETSEKLWYDTLEGGHIIHAGDTIPEGVKVNKSTSTTNDHCTIRSTKKDKFPCDFTYMESYTEDILDANGRITGKSRIRRDNKEFTDCYRYIEEKNKDDNGGKHLEIAERLLQEYSFKTFDDTEEVVIYQHGVYVPGETIIKAKAETELKADGATPTTHTINEIIGHIKRQTYISRSKFDNSPNVVNLQNGLLHTKKFEFRHHTPEYLSLNQLPVTFNPFTNTKQIIKFLEEVIPDKNDRDTLLEYFGYCLYKSYPLHKALILVGGGANGKTTTIALLGRMLGTENTSSMSLHELVGDKFKVGELYGKLANLSPDLPSKTLYQTGVFKAATGGDYLLAEKKFKNPFKFINHAKLIFSCNQLPPSDDKSVAFYRRWIIIEFPNEYNDDKADPKLLETLATDGNLSGLLNLSVMALKSLFSKYKFTNHQKTDAIAEEYEKRSNPTLYFIEERCEVDKYDDQCFVGKSNLHSEYIDFSKKFNLPRLSTRSFTELMKLNGFMDGVKKVEKHSERVWFGIRLLQKTMNHYQ